MSTLETCTFHYDYDPETLDPRGAECGDRATHEIHWKDGSVSPACDAHGFDALDTYGKSQVACTLRVAQVADAQRIQPIDPETQAQPQPFTMSEADGST